MRLLERTAALVLAALVVTIAVTGCRPGRPRAEEEFGIRDEYVGLDYPRGTIDLALKDDGSFVMTCGAVTVDRHHCVPAESITGRWECHAEGELKLSGDGEEIVFAPDTTTVIVNNRSGTLPSLLWVRSTASTFADSTELIACPDFYDFLHPGGGVQLAW